MESYKEKHAQANREALATVVALAIVVVVWIVCGFGLSGLDITVYHTPLWVIGGTLGTWVCAIVVSVVLAKRFFVGFDLDEEDDGEAHLQKQAEKRPELQSVSESSASGKAKVSHD